VINTRSVFPILSVIGSRYTLVQRSIHRQTVKQIEQVDARCSGV
jgi:hypothetical protein